MRKGNKGEWSELYTFLKLLSDGELYAADENLNKIHDIYYPLIKILRMEKGRELEYYHDKQMITIEDVTNHHTIKMPISEFKNHSLLLLEKIITSTGRSFAVDEIEDFLDSIQYDSLKAHSSNKSDIHIVVHDKITGMEPSLGFSIKSRLGKASTLFNAGVKTNLVYKVSGNFTRHDINEINEINTKTNKIRNRLKKIKEKNLTLEFVKVADDMFNLNLQVIDSKMPEILSELVLYYFSGMGSELSKLLELMNNDNPLQYNNLFNHNFYEYKVKAFLRDVALGMTPAKKWDGQFDATGGYIIVKEDGELVCYHIYNQNEFQQYLLTNTKLDSPSSTRHRYGKIYEQDGECFFNLNFQIRFI